MAGPGGFRDLYLGERQKYLALNSEGLKLSEKFEMRDTGLLSFKLFFPPLPRGVNSIDVIESPDESGGLACLGIEFES